jgi:hypothetical protein
MNSELKNISAIEDPVEIVAALISLLSSKEQEIIRKRYGLNGEEILTLAAIGDQFGVTRERVRQVQCYAIKKMQRNAKNTHLRLLHDWLANFLKDAGNIITESELDRALLKKFPEYGEKLQELKLACILDETVTQEYNKVDFVPHFRASDIAFGEVKKVCNTAIKAMRKEGDLMSANQLIDALGSDAENMSKKCLLASLKLDRRIVVGENGLSLKAWRHINPKTLFDKILFVLSESSEPMHFSEIAEKIKKENFDDKSVSVQAVHNELINNSLFVLIGRGIYALKTWGYKEGTVSDVIESILEKSGPLHLKDLTQEVLQRRKVKPITVQINLNSKKHKFRKNQHGMYELV